MKTAQDYIADGAALAATPITAVVARPVAGGSAWRYFAVLADGSEVVLRKRSTRLSGYAHFYAAAVASGASGLAAHFGYSVRPRPNYDWCPLVKCFAVEVGR